MDIEVTPEAIEVLKRSLDLAGLSATESGIRLRTAHGLGGGVEIQVELADGPSEDERTIELDGLKLFVSPAVIEAVPDPVLTVEPQHETVVVRPRS
ncbi:MAG TPA: hypothetical protein VNP73_11440 [Actinomycetota bacterium]|nr:hypothetical protein [Actinomycetota bacterium]